MSNLTLTAMRHRNRGVSAIELMVVLMLIAMMVSLTVPTIQKKHIASLQENIQSSLRTAVLLAQTEAIKRSDEVVVCPLQSRDSIRCADPVTWRNGWLVFVDGDGDMLYSAGSDELIRINIMDENPFYAEYSAACFSLNAQGYFKATDSVFTVCADDGTLDPVAYTILKYGEFMPLSDTDGNGNPNDLNGDDLVCK